MSWTKIMLLVLMVLQCCSSAQVTLTRVFPGDGAYICPGDVVAYKCVVQSFQLTWTYTIDAGGTESHNYLYSTPVTGNVTLLGPFGLVLESVVGSNSQSTITSTANATSGLATSDNGKVITCVGSTSKSMEISFTAPTITIVDASDCQDTISWSLPPCPANCTVNVNGQDIVTVPCSDGNVSIGDTDLGNNTLMIKIIATDQLGRHDEVQEVCIIPTTPSIEMGQTVANSISADDLPTPTLSPTGSGANTAVILGTCITLVAAGVIVVGIILLIVFLSCRHLKKHGHVEMLVHEEGRVNQTTPSAEVKESLSVDIKLPVKDNHHQHPITHCAFSPDADYFVTADIRLVVNLWKRGDQNGIDYKETFSLKDVKKKMKSSKGKVPDIPKNQKLLLSINWMPKSEESKAAQLMLAYDNCVLLWDIENGTVSDVFVPKVPDSGFLWDGFKDASILCATCNRFGPTRSYAFSFTSELKTQSCKGHLLLRIKSKPKDQEDKTLAQETSAVVSMIFSSNGEKLVTGNIDGIIQVYDVNQPDQSCVKRQSLGGIIWQLHFGSDDEKIIYSLVEGQQFYLWDTSSSEIPPVSMIACGAYPRRPPQPSAGKLANHPVTWRNKSFGSCCDYKYILINSPEMEREIKLLYKVKPNFMPEDNSVLSEKHFSCLDCLTNNDATFCVMASSTDNSLTFFKLGLKEVTETAV